MCFEGKFWKFNDNCTSWFLWNQLYFDLSVIANQIYKTLNSRVLCGGVLNYGWNIGSLLMTFLAYFIRSWSNLQLSFAFISLVLVSYYFLVPESPRWLISKGQTEEVYSIRWGILKILELKDTKTRLKRLSVIKGCVILIWIF